MSLRIKLWRKKFAILRESRILHRYYISGIWKCWVHRYKSARSITRNFVREFELDNLNRFNLRSAKHLERYANRYSRWKHGVETVIASDILNRFNFSWFSQSPLLLCLPVSRQSDASRKIARLLHSDILTSFTPRPSLQKERCQENNRNSSEKVMYLGYISSARCSRPEKNEELSAK